MRLPLAAAFAAFAALIAVPARADLAQTVLGIDVGANIPVGKMADGIGTEYLGALRIEHTLQPQMAVTGRVGYLLGSDKEASAGGMKVTSGTDVALLWVGIVYRTTGKPDGLFATAEIGPARISGHTTFNGSTTTVSDTKFGGEIGGGWRAGPLSARLALSALNISETTNTSGLLVSIGWDFKAL